jgi:hypothetical protein
LQGFYTVFKVIHRILRFVSLYPNAKLIRDGLAFNE